MRGPSFNWRGSVRTKLFAFFTAVTIVVTATIGIVTYRFSMSTIMRQSRQLVAQAQQQVVQSIRRNVSKYESLVRSIAFDPDIQRFVAGEYGSAYEEYLIATRIKSRMESLLAATGTPSNLAIVRLNDELTEYIPRNIHGVLPQIDRATLSDDPSYQVYNAARVSDDSWITSLSTIGPVETRWLQIRDDQEMGTITLVQPVSTFGLPADRAGFLNLTLHMKDIFQFDGTYGDESRLYYSVLDATGAQLYPVDPALASADQKDGRYWMVRSEDRLLPMEWTLVTGAELEGAQTYIVASRRIITLLCLAGIVIVAVVSFRVSDRFGRRVAAISEHMSEYQAGIQGSAVGYSANDELAYLAEQFNELVERTDDLVSQVYKSNLAKKEAELRALQAQINPHFLYNSLASIELLASGNDGAGVSRIIDSLVKYYRLTLNEGRDVVSVADEVAQIKAYLDIHEVRMGEYFNVAFDIDKRALQYKTLKMILQPFVENIFEHALSNLDSVVHIQIGVALDGEDIVYSVSDDGIGIDATTMSEIESGGTRRGYGIANVNDRVRLYFGSRFGIRLTNTGTGTRADIRIPKME